MKQCKILTFTIDHSKEAEEHEINRYLAAGYEIKAVYAHPQDGCCRYVYLEKNC